MGLTWNAQKTKLQLRYPRQALGQRGEVSLFFVMALVALSSLMVLLSLELNRELKLLHKRKELLLCTKEIKGELNDYLVFMGRTNWGLKNAKRAAVLAFWFPPLAGSAENAKRILKTLQASRLVSYLNSLRRLRQKGCSLDPRMATTPFILGLDGGYQRSVEDAAKLRKEKWAYYFVDSPYAIEIRVEAAGLDRLHPQLRYLTAEKGEKLFSLLSSR